MTDAPKAIEVAAARALDGRPETAALLSDAVGALVAYPSDEKDAKRSKLDLGKNGGFSPASAIRLTPNGAAIGFTIDGHAWTVDRAAPTYQVMGVRRDGAVLSIGQLASVKGIPREGNQWGESGYKLVKLRGSPRVALSGGGDNATGPNVKLLGAGADGFDVVTVAPPGADFVVEGELAVRGAPGGIALRAQATKKGFRGAALVVTPGGATVLSAIDDSGETQLATPITPSPVGPLRVKLTVQGTKLEAVVGGSTLTATLPDSMGTGDVAVIAKRGGNVEITGFTVKRK
jgi:hypothetical protein